MSRKTQHTTAAAVKAPVVSEKARLLTLAAIVLLVFFGSYRYATARTAASTATTPSAAATASAATSGTAPTSAAPTTGGDTTAAGTSAASGTSARSGSAFQGACACCGGGASSGKTVKGTAALDGTSQRIIVDTSTGAYSPNVIALKAGVPARITFKQASGCLGQVVSSDLGFSEDLTGGDKTVELPALKAGTYSFNCGMGMVFGRIVVK